MRRFKDRTSGSSAEKQRGAFTLIEVLIVVVILGIIATVVVPQFSNASFEARENTLKDDLRYIRIQMQVYKAQHEDRAPGYPNGVTTSTPTEAAFVDQMTRYSNEIGVTAAVGSNSYKFGPYLTKVPENPINGKTAIKMIPNGTAMPAPDASESYGWIYKAETQEFICNLTGNDSTGKTPYSRY